MKYPTQATSFFGTLYRAHERLLGRPTFAYLAELERSQWASRQEIEAIQLHKLRALLKTALRHSPWHAERIRQAGLDEGALDAMGLDDLARLPTMTRQDARENRDRIAWLGVPGGAYLYNTGGSSGEPLIFYFGKWRQASDTAGRFRAQRWWGVEVGEPQVWLWGAGLHAGPTDKIKLLRDRMVNQLFLNAFEMTLANMDAYIQAIRRFRPKSLYGYASSLSLLAARAQEKGVDMRLPGLKAVFTTGEPLYPHQRDLLQEVFGVPAASEYGSRDVGFTAHESPTGRILLMSESIILEVLDGDGHPVKPGELGEAVVTGLCSQAQPFIRYRTGDVVRYTGQTCPEGRGLHVLGEVSGRTTDFVTRSDGTIMHALAVIYVLRATPGVARFKFIQHAVDDVEVWVVTGPQWNEERRTQVVEGLKARLGENVQVGIRLMEDIPAEASGKHRYVVSHVPLPEALRGVVG
ncbi:phenylacetate-CoA ligase [Desulfacinum hydrothermale DSM 13146]|uniref:Phenylacetate-CoA ligase n=1 Tax=Desulfacinum hydrothermale DSM 13146 TaxID=1121390 RepID=A0A1W1XR07_9BACT|nr:phenylacetate--CoA ligase family protein [Desulfacinum hydrothermale]SMC26336.1 phenylacetate-CoA ligase [Desulfacinum hydrothermale DSM 13146]